MNAHPPTQGRDGWRFLLVFGFLVAAILLGSVLYLHRQQAAARSSAQTQLEAVADLKVQQIVNWRKERLLDTTLILGNPALAVDTMKALAQPESAKTLQVFKDRLDPLFTSGPYERVLLLDDKLNLRLVYPEGASHALSDSARRSAEEALRTRQIVVTDFHRSEQDAQVYLNFVVPLVVHRDVTNDAVPAAGRDPAPAARSAGVVVLKLNAQDFLFPLIQSWPTTSPTAETLLVRREGQEVLYLNELRHQKGTAMKLRRPLAEPRLPAAIALRGERVMGECLDYRGVRVVAAVRPVPDTPWLMVAKVDTAELYAPLRQESLMVVSVSLALLLASALAVTLLWRHREALFLQAQLEMEQEEHAATARAHEATRESETRYRSLFENMLNGFAYHRMLSEPGRPDDFLYLAVNTAFKTLTGLQDVVGKNMSEVIPGLRRSDPELFEIYGRVVRTGVPEHFERYVQAMQMWFAISVYRPAPEHLVALFDVITARKQAEEALRETEARIRKMLEMAPVPMCHLTGDGMIEFRNERFVHVFGYTAEDMPSLAEWWRRAFPDPEYRQWAIESWDKAVRHAAAGERDIAGVDYKITCKSGEERRFEISGIMLGEELLVTFIDVTEHKLAQEIARKFNVELEQQVRQRTASLEAAVKELDAFAYSVSHDLRAPLRHVGGYAGLLRTSAGPSLPETSRHYLDEITGAATQMGRLIDDLLQFSRMGRTEMRQERIELTGLAEECIQQLKPEINGRNILWQQHPLPAVQADPALLRQVLINLLSNAIKYTRPRDPAKIEIGCASENGREAVIFVRDNGVGFDMEYSNKLFGVFQRLHADDEFEGTGVGLANVRRIIARHGGRTWAEGKVNEGATFYFSLPI
ncbi:MAG: ATP-binding protein [Verrucomicrobiota bacterium]